MNNEPFSIKSPAFNDGEKIPHVYACDGKGINPLLEFVGVPINTQTFALIVDDPDATRGTFVHWVIWNIPAETRVIPEASSPFGISGLNDADEPGYVGPCPSAGVHRYFFRVFALDKVIDLPEGKKASDLAEALKGHIIGEAKLMGLYERKKN